MVMNSYTVILIGEEILMKEAISISTIFKSTGFDSIYANYFLWNYAGISN